MKTSRPVQLLGIGVGSLLMLVLVVSVAGYLSAPHFYLTRSIFWGESDYKDYEKFPARTIHNAPPTFRFDQLPPDNPYASQIEAIGNRSINGNLVNYLESSGTTAFLMIHDDELVYERYFDGYDETSVHTSFSMAKSFFTRSTSRAWMSPSPTISPSCSRKISTSRRSQSGTS